MNASAVLQALALQQQDLSDTAADSQNDQRNPVESISHDDRARLPSTVLKGAAGVGRTGQGLRDTFLGPGMRSFGSVTRM
jgi:hypothetical protein